ncbi:glycosyltransferase [Solirubrobacter soli]|uniref:glycosyltransferase n=1 Tax=Solirubrobacter soli TaxID=363832 RepID=UPI00146E8635|nr:glycosyltransferase [Solirubrobacter soli]
MRDPIPALVVSPILPEPPVTGGQKRTLRLLEAIERAGMHPRILTADHGDEASLELLRGRGWTVEVVREPEPGPLDRIRQHVQRRPSPYLGSLAVRFEVLAKDAALVQYEHTQSAYYRAPKTAAKVLSLHNIDSRAAASSAEHLSGLAWLREANRAAELKSVERRAIPRADRVLCVSEADAAVVRAIGGRAVLAPNGVDDDFFAVDGPGDANRVLFFGHFGYEANRRGIERFLREGWPRVRELRPGTRLAIAGGGPTGGLEGDGVDILGLVPDLAAVLATARAVIVPIWEGGGTRLKVLEALAAARVVVSTPLGASGIGFEHERHGLLAESPEALATALAGALDQPSTYGPEGRILAERYRWKEALSGASTFYAEVRARARFAR